MAVMEIILSTSNIINAGSSNFRRLARSNAELVESLRSNLESHYAPGSEQDVGTTDYKSWTTSRGQTLEVPTLHLDAAAPQEDRDQYDITLKLFFLHEATQEQREKHARQALDLVLKELGMESVDLLIASFPGMYFDEEEESLDKIKTRGPIEDAPEALDAQIATWRALEKLHDEKLVKKLGIAEFGHDRLKAFLEQARVTPSVDQINLRDCCSVPKDLLALSRQVGVDLLVHNDCSNILPRGTVRELLGPRPDGAGILASSPKTGDKRKGLHGETQQPDQGGSELEGEVNPRWVVKYTAVVRTRGVVENKGYFAMAELAP